MTETSRSTPRRPEKPCNINQIEICTLHGFNEYVQLMERAVGVAKQRETSGRMAEESQQNREARTRAGRGKSGSAVTGRAKNHPVRSTRPANAGGHRKASPGSPARREPGWLAAVQPRKRGGPKLKALRAVWGSYQGHLVHANAWRLLRRLWELHPVSRSLLALKGGRVDRRLALPRPALSLREQCERLSLGLAPAVLFVKVGRNAEFRWRSAALRLGLRWTRRNGRQCAAIPWLEINEVLRRGLMQGMMLGIAVEMPWFEGGLVARRLAYVVRPYPHSKSV
jgi:hypothetical protein